MAIGMLELILLGGVVVLAVLGVVALVIVLAGQKKDGPPGDLD
jgi:hypothetical protein